MAEDAFIENGQKRRQERRNKCEESSHSCLMRHFMMSHVVVSHVVLWFIHHLEHWQATSTDKPDHKHCCYDQEDDIKHRGIVPLDALSDSNNIAVLWDKPKRLKQKFDHVSSRCHRDVKGHQNIAHHFPTIVFAINVENGKNYQVGKDEADDTTKANSASP